MRAQHDVGVLLYEEGVLHVARGMVGGEIQRREDVPVIFHLGSVGDGEAKAREDVDNFVLHDGERMARAERGGVGRAGEVEAAVVVLLGCHASAQLREFFLQGRLQLVKLHAYFPLLVGCHVAEFRHQAVYHAFLAQIFYAQLLKRLRVGGFQSRHLAEQRLYLLFQHKYAVFLFPFVLVPAARGVLSAQPAPVRGVRLCFKSAQS